MKMKLPLEYLNWKKSIYKIVFISIGLFTSCSSPEDKIIVDLLNPYIGNTKSSTGLVIIPREGCGGCINSTTVFMKKYLPQLENTFVIYTGVEDKKLFKLQVGEDFLKNSKVIIDSENNLLRNEIIPGVYPRLYVIKDNILIKKIDFDESDEYFENLVKL